MNIKHQIIYWLPVYLYAALIFYFSSQPQIPLQARGNIYIWILHMVEYYGLSFLLLRALLNSRFKKKAFLLAIFIAVVYGIIDELHQLFVLGRVSSLVDVLFDGIGSSLILVYSLRIFQDNRFLTKLLS